MDRIASLATFVRVVDAGGVFFAPGFVVAETLAAGTLVLLMPAFGGVDFAVNAFYPRRQHLAAKVRRFLDMLVVHFTKHQKGGICAIPDTIFGSHRH